MTFVLIGQRCSGNSLLRKELIKKGKSLHALQALFSLRCCPFPARKLLREFRSLGRGVISDFSWRGQRRLGERSEPNQ